jgi:hypothetical protein
VSQSSRTPLSSGIVNHDRLLIELVEPPDSPPIVVITWPSKASVHTPTSYPAAAAAITRIIAESATKLSRIKAAKRM